MPTGLEISHPLGKGHPLGEQMGQVMMNCSGADATCHYTLGGARGLRELLSKRDHRGAHAADAVRAKHGKPQLTLQQRVLVVSLPTANRLGHPAVSEENVSLRAVTSQLVGWRGDHRSLDCSVMHAGLGGWPAGRLRRKGEGTMDLDRESDGRVRQFMADVPLTMEGLDVLLFRDVDVESADDPEVARVFKQRRWEAVLKSVLVQLARATGDKPMSVEMTYDPVASPHRPIYGPIYGPPRV